MARNLKKKKFVGLIINLSDVADLNFGKIASLLYFSLKLSVTFSISIFEEKVFIIS